MPDRPNLLSLDVLGLIRLGQSQDDERRELARLVSDGLTADSTRVSWFERQKALTKLRFGVRDKKDFPWPGASNISIPVIDAQIRRYKPLLMRLVVESDPIVEFTGEDPEAVEAERVAEAEYNWLFRQVMNASEAMAYVIDGMCHRGFAYAQVGWDYRTEYECRIVDVAALLRQAGEQAPQDAPGMVQLLRLVYDIQSADAKVERNLQVAAQSALEGRPFVKIAWKRVVSDRPAVWDRDAVQVIAPPRCTDVGNAEWIIVQHVLSAREIKQREADGFFVAGSSDKIVGELNREKSSGPSAEGAWSTTLSLQKQLDDERERIWGSEDPDNVLIWECYHWHDFDGDGIKERVVTWLHPRTSTSCGTRPYPYPFHRWPFVKFEFEKTGRRLHAPRGISGMLEGIQRVIDGQHNARLDAMAIRNAPVYQMPVVAGFKARNFRAIPGSIIETPMGATISPIMQDRSGFPESVNEENLLRMLAENYVGNFDNAVMSPGSATRRTATEVNAAVSLAASTSSLDAILFQLAMHDLHVMVWQLWLDLRPEEVSYKVQGLDPANAEAKLITVQKGEIDKKFKLVPTGTIANTNRALELATAEKALSFFVNDQTGFINHYELVKWYLTLLDYRRARRVVNSPDQARELQVLRQAAAELQADPGLAASLQGGVSRPEQEVTNTQVQ